MTANSEFEKVMYVIGQNTSVNVVFSLSDHGRLDSVYPEKNSKQVSQWAVVLMPLLQKLMEFSGFRFTKIDYRQGGLWIWSLGPKRFLLIITKPNIEAKSFLTQISPFIQTLHENSVGDGEEETLLGHDLQQLLYEASDHLKQYARSEDGFFGALRISAFLYFGVLGEEWVDQSFEQLWLTLPMKQKKPMEDLINEVKKRIPHPLKRLTFEHDAKLLMTQFTQE
ncbi:MAG: hypothetical protein V4507_02315 [Verrucomicrobiota bacterium]